MDIKQIKVSELKPYEKNAKKHNAKQIKQVANSIEAFGFNQPLVVDKDNVLIVGHGRLEAAKLLGLQEVPCYIVDIPEDKAKAYRLADNKLNESDWDIELVIDELKTLSVEDVELTGFDNFDIEDFSSELNDEIECKKNTGVIYQYNLIFDNEEHQDVFFTFIRDLKKNEDGETISERLFNFIKKQYDQ